MADAAEFHTSPLHSPIRATTRQLGLHNDFSTPRSRALRVSRPSRQRPFSYLSAGQWILARHGTSDAPSVGSHNSLAFDSSGAFDFFELLEPV